MTGSRIAARARAVAFVREWNTSGRPRLDVEAILAWEDCRLDPVRSRRREAPAWARELADRFARAGGLAFEDLVANTDRDDEKGTPAAVWRSRAGWALVRRGMSLAAAGRVLGDRAKQSVAKWVRAVNAEVAADPGLGAQLGALVADAGDELAARRRVA